MTEQTKTQVVPSALVGSISPTDSVLTVLDATLFSSQGTFRIAIVARVQGAVPELCLVESVAANLFTVTRGIEGTTAAAHDDGAIVAQVVTDAALRALIAQLAVASVTAIAPIVSSGGENPTISHADASVTAATYGDSAHVAQVTVDAKGHLQSAGAIAIQISESQVTGLDADLTSLANLANAAGIAASNAQATATNAQNAAATAQSTATTAQSTATSAQTTATNAATAAATAQTTATNAATAAATAQATATTAETTATAAQVAAVAAQADADSKVASVAAADGTIVAGGSPTSPTVRVGTIAQSQVAGLVTALAQAGASFLVQPGGVAGGNVFTAIDTTLAAAVKACKGKRHIVLDTSLTPTTTVQVATGLDFGFANGPVTLQGMNLGGTGSPQVNFANGATLLDGLFFRELRNITLTHANTSLPLCTFTGPGALLADLYEGAQINATTGTTPIVKVTNATPYIGILIRLHDNSAVNSGAVTGAEVFQIDGAGSILIADALDASSFGPSVFKYTNSPPITLVRLFSPAASISASQPNAPGFSFSVGSLAANVAYSDASPTLGATTVQAAIDALKARAAVLIWRPGGVAGGTVYTTAATVAAASRAVVGSVDIIVDGSIATPNFPVGTTDFGSSGPRRLIGDPQNSFRTQITTDTANVVVLGLTEIRDIQITSTSTAANGLFQYSPASSSQLSLSGRTTIDPRGTTPVIGCVSGDLVVNASDFVVVQSFGSGTQAIKCIAGVIALLLYDGAFIDSNQLDDNVGAGLIVTDVFSPSVSVSASQPHYTNPTITIFSQLSGLAGTLSDAQHGARSGGTLHAAVVASGANGFMLGTDKAKLDGIEAGAQVTSSARVLTALAAAAGDVSVNSHKITNLATPTAATDAASKSYVDAVAAGLSVKPSVLVLSTTNVAALTGILTTIDGVLVSTPGSRVALTGQSTATQNGLWVVAVGAWTRPTDFATGSDAAGTFVFVEQGTANASSGWTCTSVEGSAVVDTNNLAFTQFSGAGEVLPGAGMTKSGNTLNVTNAAAIAALSGTNTGDQTITLTGDVTGTGAGSFAATLGASFKNGDIGMVFDGNGSVVTVGTFAYRRVPYKCTIASWLVDGRESSGAIAIDVWYCSDASFPPTVANSIIGSSKPTISSGQKASGSVASWTTLNLNAGDWLAFHVDSATTFTWADIILPLTRVA